MERDIAIIRQELTDAQNQLATHQSALTSGEISLAGWKNAGNSDLSNKLERIQWWTAEVERLRALVNGEKATIASLTAELDTAIKGKEAIDKGLAQAAAEGLTGPEAMERAKAITRQEKLKANAIYIGIALIAIAAGLWLWRKYRTA